MYVRLSSLTYQYPAARRFALGCVGLESLTYQADSDYTTSARRIGVALPNPNRAAKTPVPVDGYSFSIAGRPLAPYKNRYGPRSAGGRT